MPLTGVPVQLTTASSIPEDGPGSISDDTLDGIQKAFAADQRRIQTQPRLGTANGAEKVPMSPSCMRPQELAAQMLFSEQEVGRLQVELQAAHRREADLKSSLQVSQQECSVRSQRLCFASPQTSGLQQRHPCPDTGTPPHLP